MAEYIDRMKVRIAIIDTKWICDQDEDVAYEMIDSIPAADVEDVKHGRWTEAEDGDGAICSVCGEDFCNVYLEVERFLYCPNCGAKMDGGKDETK